MLRELSAGLLLLFALVNGIVAFNPNTHPPETETLPRCLKWSTHPANELVCHDVPEKDRIEVDVERMKAEFKRWDRNHY